MSLYHKNNNYTLNNKTSFTTGNVSQVQVKSHCTRKLTDCRWKNVRNVNTTIKQHFGVYIRNLGDKVS